MAQNEPLASPFALSEGVKASEGLCEARRRICVKCAPHSNGYRFAFHGNATLLVNLPKLSPADLGVPVTNIGADKVL